MDNHIGGFIPVLDDVTAATRSLLNKISASIWELSQDEAFARLKLLLSSLTFMAKYHPRYPTVVSADASSCPPEAVLLLED